MRKLLLLSFLCFACKVTSTSTMPSPRPAPGPNDAPPGDGWQCSNDGACLRAGEVCDGCTTADTVYCYLGTDDGASCFRFMKQCADAMQAEYSATVSSTDTQVTECGEWN